MILPSLFCAKKDPVLTKNGSIFMLTMYVKRVNSRWQCQKDLQFTNNKKLEICRLITRCVL